MEKDDRDRFGAFVAGSFRAEFPVLAWAEYMGVCVVVFVSRYSFVFFVDISFSSRFLLGKVIQDADNSGQNEIRIIR
jgi:hypothetical protein